VFHIRSWDNVGGLVTRPWSEHPRSCGFIPGGAMCFSSAFPCAGKVFESHICVQH